MQSNVQQMDDRSDEVDHKKIFVELTPQMNSKQLLDNIPDFMPGHPQSEYSSARQHSGRDLKPRQVIQYTEIFECVINRSPQELKDKLAELKDSQ